MEYEIVRLLKKSNKSESCLVREKGSGRLFVRKVHTGRHPVYQTLQKYPHPCLPRLHEVELSDDSTIVVEEYIEGKAADSWELSGKQYLQIARELCNVLEFLHGKGIIHRDVKPSNILLTEEGKMYLIDFDAARMPREGLEQDTRLLGTRGFAPPEQYGFAQTDERADIYALGVTLDQLLPEKMKKPHYRRVLRKCMNLDPERRYQSVGKVKRAFFSTGKKALGGLSLICLLVLAGGLGVWLYHGGGTGHGEGTEDAALTVLPAPENPHWVDGTANLMWGNVPESGTGDEVRFQLRFYRRDTETPPEPEDSDWYREETFRAGGRYKDAEVMDSYVVKTWDGNGYYYFTVSALGEGIYADSPYAVSDVFEYTGEGAPPLPSPEGLAWKLTEKNNSRYYCASWSNLEDYAEQDVFNVTFYDETDTYVMNNRWPKKLIEERGLGGVPIPAEFLSSHPGSAYRFVVEVYSSRPNEYGANMLSEPVPEECFSPWYYCGPIESDTP